MAPSPEHKRYKKLAGRFVETLAEELDIRIEPLGSTTFKHPELSGAEPDECFYIYNIDAVRGKKRLSPLTDPPPDLVVEMPHTRQWHLLWLIHTQTTLTDIAKVVAMVG